MFIKEKIVFLFKSISLVLVFFIIACNQNGKNSKLEAKNSRIINHKPKSTVSDSMVILGRAAVFYYPDSIQLNKIKSITDPQIADGTMHELQFQIKYSKKIIRSNWRELNILDARNVRFLVFKKDTGNQIIIDLDTFDDPYGLFVFNGNKAPVWIDMTNLEQGLHYYFNVN